MPNLGNKKTDRAAISLAYIYSYWLDSVVEVGNLTDEDDLYHWCTPGRAFPYLGYSCGWNILPDEFLLFVRIGIKELSTLPNKPAWTPEVRDSIKDLSLCLV